MRWGLYDRDGRREFLVSAWHWESGSVSFVVYMRPFYFFCIIRFFALLSGVFLGFSMKARWGLYLWACALSRARNGVGVGFGTYIVGPAGLGGLSPSVEDVIMTRFGSTTNWCLISGTSCIAHISPETDKSHGISHRSPIRPSYSRYRTNIIHPIKWKSSHGRKIR